MQEEDLIPQYRSQNFSSNEGFNDFSPLRIRLDTEPLMDKIELFLRGEKLIVAQDDSGKIQTQRVKLGKRICNELGVQHLVNFIGSIINSQTVQGNYKEDRYSNHLYKIHCDLAYILTANYPTWEMHSEDLEVVIDFTLNLAEAFMSRLIDNKERDSYTTTAKSTETISQQPQQRRFNI